MASSPGQNRRGCRYFLNLGLFTLFALFIGVLFLQFIAHPYLFSRGFAHPKRAAVCCITPADRGFEYEDVTLLTDDQITLKGWYIPSQNRAAVILLHSIAANRLGTLRHAEMLAHNGYGTLMLDLRVHGESGGEILTYGGDEVYDVLAAVDYLLARDDVDSQRIGALGLSLGTNFVILGAARTDDIAAIITEGIGATTREDWPPQPIFWRIYDSVFYQFLKWHTGVWRPVSMMDAVTQIQAPILFIGAASEEPANRQFAAVANNPQVWIIPGGSHINGIIDAPEEYQSRVITFFNDTLLKD